VELEMKSVFMVAVTLVSLGVGAMAAHAQQPFTHEDLLKEVNKFRKENKLPELKPQSQLDAAAKVYADDLAKRNRTFEQMKNDGHRDSSGHGPVDRAKAAGYTLAVTENALLGSQTTTAHEAFTAWLNSAGHKRNLMTDFATDSGFAAAKGTNGSWYFVHKIGGKSTPKTDLKNGDWVTIKKAGDPTLHIARIMGMGTQGDSSNVIFNMVYFKAKNGEPTGKEERVRLKDTTVTITKLP
jgi:Cysteine-rich secretory protein family